MSDYPSQRNNNDSVYWLIALGLIITGVLAPIGILMIVLKVLDGDKKRGRHPYHEQQHFQGQTGARTTAPRAGAAPPPPPFRAAAPAPPPPPPPFRAPQAAPRNTLRTGVPVWEETRDYWRFQINTARNTISRLDKKGKTLAIVGGVISAIFLLALTGTLGDAVYWLFAGEFALFAGELFGMIPLLCFMGGGLGCLWAGLRKRKQASRFRNYLAMVGRQKSVSISALASAMGCSPARVRDDLADMLDDGLFPQGFLDYGGDRLVLSGDGITDPPKERTAPPPPEKEDENAILAEIKAVNDAIDNEKMTGQIDRIGVITAKILDYQKVHPDKAPQLHSFLSYYLPTTLKILRAYSQLEDQEVAGQNITAAMSRIEGMMDKVVEGFEKQLDLLFQGDAMDITTDVEVLERMLAKDGLSDQEGLTLGF